MYKFFVVLQKMVTVQMMMMIILIPIMRAQ